MACYLMLPSFLAVFLVLYAVKCLHFWCNKGYFDHVSPGKALKKSLHTFSYFAPFSFFTSIAFVYVQKFMNFLPE